MLGAGEALGVGEALAADDVDGDEPLRQRDRGLDRLRQPRAQVLLHHEPVDDDLDRVLELLVERRRLFEQVLLAVDLDAREALVAQFLEEVLVLALAVAHNGRVDREARALGEREDLLDDRVDRLARDRPSTHRAVRPPDARVEEAQVVVDLGDGADSRARIARRRLLVDRDRRRKSVDRVDVRLLHHLEELPRVGRQRLDVAPLSLGVDRVEGEARLAGPGEAGDADQRVAREPDGDVLEVVLPCAVNDEFVRSHEPVIVARRTYVREGDLRLAPAAEHEAAEGEAEAEGADGEAADRDALAPGREPLPPAERLLLLGSERLAAAPLPQRAAGADAEVEIVEDFAALVRHRTHCSLLRPCQHASFTFPTCISGRARPSTSPSWSARSPTSCSASTRLSSSRAAT